MRKNGKENKTVKNIPIPSAVFENGAHMELFSNKEAVIDGIKGVLEYSDSFIKLNIGRGTVEFWGNGLEITALDINGLSISGKISKIEFCS